MYKYLVKILIIKINKKIIYLKLSKVLNKTSKKNKLKI